MDHALRAVLLPPVKPMPSLPAPEAPSLSILTYNILADAYLRPEWYAQVAPALLEPGPRQAALLARLEAADADVLCLQEVEPGVYQALHAHLQTLGYRGYFLRKGRQRADGCATFIRWQKAPVQATIALRYADRGHRDQD